MKTYENDAETRDQIDHYLAEINAIRASLGTDSTPEERASAKKKEKYRLDQIKKIDETFWAQVRGYEYE